MSIRTPVPKPVETQVLTASHRRCCLCYYLSHNKSPRKGQIAHLNQDPADSSFENLVWICLEHHDEFDSQTSQSKGLTVGEVRTHRDRLYRELAPPAQNVNPPPPPTPAAGQALPEELRGIVANAKGAFDHLLLPWKFHPWREVRRFLFPYKAMNRSDGSFHPQSTLRAQTPTTGDVENGSGPPR